MLLLLVPALALTAVISSASGVDILGGSPLAIDEPPFENRVHNVQPDDRWGTANQSPYPTNAWWTNLVLGSGESVVSPLPYLIKTLDDGIQISFPDKVVQPGYMFMAFVPNMIITAMEGMGYRSLKAWDPLSVTMEYEGVELPLVRGSPYITAKFTGRTPILASAQAVIAVNGQNVGGYVSGSRFEVSLNNGQTWIVYTSSDVGFNINSDSLVADAQFTGSLRVACMTTGQSANDLDMYSGKIPIGGEVMAQSSGDTATMNFNWKTEGDGELMIMALPHHMDIMTSPKTADLSYNTIKGDMTAILGEVWTLVEPLTTIQWNAPRGVAPQYMDAVRDALKNDIGTQVVADDPYFGGKQMATLARLALIADEFEETDLANTYRQNLKTTLEGWLSGTNGDYFTYDTTWGGLITRKAMDDGGADFGQGMYNDHHFHYGYYMYAAGVLAKADPAWAEQWKAPLLHILRDIAEPSGSDPYYTVTRMKDWYMGHSWASGITEFADSHNQESSSESVNGWYGVYLFGLGIGDQRITDLGRLLMATEIRATHKYWQITSADNIYPEPYAANKVVGILWGIKVDYATWFGANLEFIHGIQWLPFTPISEEVLRPQWIAEEYPVVSPAINSAGEGWKGFIYMAHAVIDNQAGWEEVNSLNTFDDGNSRTNALHWVATRPEAWTDYYNSTM